MENINMKTSPVGRQLIESFEGLILKAYDDANDHVVKPGETVKGVLTIGYGHTNSAGPPKVFVGQVITREEADKILASDLGKVEADVTRLVKVSLNQNQFDALVSFHFNTGALGKSSLLKKLNAKDYLGAAEGLMAWTKAKQIGPGDIPGLVRRRKAEKALFLNPIVPSVIKPTVSATPSAAGAAAAVVVTGTAVAVANSGYHWGYIIGGAVLAAIVIWLGICVYVYNKKDNLNV